MKVSLVAGGLTLVGIVIGFVGGNFAARRGADLSARSSPPVRTVSERRAAAVGGKDLLSEGTSRNSAGDREMSGLSATDAFALVEALDAIDEDIEPLEKARKAYECEMMLERLPLSLLEQLIVLSQKSDLSKEVTSHLFAVMRPAIGKRRWRGSPGSRMQRLCSSPRFVPSLTAVRNKRRKSFRKPSST
jgi:hypothetical protein